MAKTGQVGSIHPSLWGDAYANFGWAGMLLYPMVFGFLLIFIEHHIIQLSSFGLYMVGSILGVCYLMVARGSVVTGFGFIGYTVPVIFVAFLVMKIPFYRYPKPQQAHNLCHKFYS